MRTILRWAPTTLLGAHVVAHASGSQIDGPDWRRGPRLVADAAAGLWRQRLSFRQIEWPPLPETVRVAALTLAIVALLIVLLSAVDAALAYVLVKPLGR
eukprot:SM000670S20386  [mRNA]  locus=s670:80:566:+ [translate_table: standard]